MTSCLFFQKVRLKFTEISINEETALKRAKLGFELLGLSALIIVLSVFLLQIGKFIEIFRFVGICLLLIAVFLWIFGSIIFSFFAPFYPQNSTLYDK